LHVIYDITIYKKVSYCKQIASQHSCHQKYRSGQERPSCKNFPLIWFDHDAKFGYCFLILCGCMSEIPNILGRLSPRSLGRHGA